MVQNNIHLTECDDLQITSHLNVEALPQFLQDLLSVAHTTEQKDMLLMSSLTTLSTVMNSVYFRYGTTGKRYYPELMTFIMAGAASGKGIAELSKRLVEKVHEDTPLIIAGDSTYPAFYQHFDGSVFQPTNEGAEVEAIVGRLAMQVKRLNDELNRSQSELNDEMMNCGEIEFRLTTEQARLLGQVMEKEYKEYVRVLGDGFHATVVRNGINVMRIAAVLSALRLINSDISETTVNDIAENPESPDRYAIPEKAGEMVCTEEDFQTAMVIGTKMLLHAADAYNQITEENKEAVPSIKGSYQKETFFVSLPESFSTGECIALAGKMGVAQRTAERYISQMVSTGLLTCPKYGFYKKCV